MEPITLVITGNALVFVPKEVWDSTDDATKESLKVNPRVALSLHATYKDYEPGEVVEIPYLLRRHVVETIIL